MREGALALLSRLDGETLAPCVRLITKLLDEPPDPSARVRARALHALAEVSGTVVEKLLPVLATRVLREDADEGVRGAAEYVLTVVDAGVAEPRAARRAGYVNAMTGLEDEGPQPDSDDSDWGED